jgi:hypothetical protein
MKVCATYSLAIAWGLALAPGITARAAEEQPSGTGAASGVHGFGETVKRDAKLVGSSVKEGAHRVAVAAKAVAHEISTAAKRGAAETRAAMKGEKNATTTTEPPR